MTFKTTLILIATIGFNNAYSQTKMDTTMIMKTNWIQVDNAPTGIYQCSDCKSSRLTINKDQTWGDFADNKKNIKIGRWNRFQNFIVLFNTSTNIGISVTVTDIKDSVMTIVYYDKTFTERKIQLKPSK